MIKQVLSGLVYAYESTIGHFYVAGSAQRRSEEPIYAVLRNRQGLIQIKCIRRRSILIATEHISACALRIGQRDHLLLDRYHLFGEARPCRGAGCRTRALSADTARLVEKLNRAAHRPVRTSDIGLNSGQSTRRRPVMGEDRLQLKQGRNLIRSVRWLADAVARRELCRGGRDFRLQAGQAV